MKSTFLSNLHYAFAQTDGTYKFPSSLEGDLLKQAKKEIELLINFAIDTANSKDIFPFPYHYEARQQGRDQSGAISSFHRAMAIKTLADIGISPEKILTNH